MEDFDIPVFKKTYDLYKLFYGWRDSIPKQDRHGIWLRSETAILDVLEGILGASAAQKPGKLPLLEKASVRLSVLRVFIRLMKDTKVIDPKKYVAVQGLIDEIGRMIGGWMRSVRNP